MNKITKWISWLLILLGILFGIIILALFIGPTHIPIKDIILAIFKGKQGTFHTILFNIRFPRIILGFAVGSALSIAGVILQGMFRNPLVEPYTLGISGGAALGVCLDISLKLYKATNFLSLPLSGFIGAILVIILVYSMSMRRGILKMQGLLLTGVMISFISSSFVMLIMAISKAEDLHGIIFWIMGSLEEPNWTLIKVASIVSILGLIISYFFSIDLNALSLGEEEAIHLGINIERSKKILFFLASLLTGVSVSVSGIIGFVGLVVPHFMRMFVGGDHRILLITSFLAGGSFLILSDTLARTIISPLELPVGVITGILGGTIFIYFLNKRKINA